MTRDLADLLFVRRVSNTGENEACSIFLGVVWLPPVYLVFVV